MQKSQGSDSELGLPVISLCCFAEYGKEMCQKL